MESIGQIGFQEVEQTCGLPILGSKQNPRSEMLGRLGFMNKTGKSLTGLVQATGFWKVMLPSAEPHMCSRPWCLEQYQAPHVTVA